MDSIQYLTCIIDDREKELIKTFDTRNQAVLDNKDSLKVVRYIMNYKVERLDIADIVISEDVGIERKAKGDFPASIKDNRLRDQLERLIQVYESPILLVEGLSKEILEECGLHINSIYGFMVKIAYKMNVPIIPTPDIEDTAVAIERIAFREQLKKNSSVVSRSCPKGMTLREQQKYIVQGLLNCGEVISENLLIAFETPGNVFEAIKNTYVTFTRTGNVKGIEGIIKDAKIPKIGPKFIQQAKKVLFNLEDGPKTSQSQAAKSMKSIQKTLI